MINWIINAVLELIGYRKKAATDKNDTRDYRAHERIKLRGGKMPRGALLWNGYPQDQGYTNRCTGFSGAHLCSVMTTVKHKELRTVDGNMVWDYQVMNGTADEEKGDYIQSTAKALIKYDFRDARGNKYRFKEFAKVKRSDLKKCLNDGYPIITGAFTHRVMCDSNWFWKSGSNKGGHAFCLVGFDEEEKCYLGLNSWGRWGIKKSGLFKIRYEDARRLFTPYILIGLEKA